MDIELDTASMGLIVRILRGRETLVAPEEPHRQWSPFMGHTVHGHTIKQHLDIRVSPN